MEGASAFPIEMRIEAERKLLAVLCKGAANAETRAAILHRLKAHTFSEPDHEVLHRALVMTPAVDPYDARQVLAQAITRLGFPDLDLDAIFHESLPAASEVDALLARL